LGWWQHRRGQRIYWSYCWLGPKGWGQGGIRTSPRLRMRLSWDRKGSLLWCWKLWRIPFL
jgi:hypothetical protein